MSFSFVLDAVKRHPKPDVVFAYGTAGFRTKGAVLESVVFRVGLLAVLRSQSQKGKIIGVMVTASHNPKDDNGVKLVDPDGEMLAQVWESYATTLANAKDEEVPQVLQDIVAKEKIDVTIPAQVIIGRDTRPSSPLLSSALADGIQTLKAKLTDLGEVTTPQLHFAVRRGNRNLPGDEQTYYTYFAEAFKKALQGVPPNGLKQKVYVDGSNGIGAPKGKILAKHLEGFQEFEIFNENGPLNEGVGADFVKTKQTYPSGVNPEADRLKKFASVDGDADRLVYYYLDGNGKFHLLDGDKIATLYALYIREELQTVGSLQLHMGVVQTAYANGASTKYLEKTMKIEVACTPTGVKHLHHRATEFDIGIYFEANGHGTVVFKEEAVQKLKDLQAKWEKDSSVSGEKKAALNRLVNLPDLINQAVGDAFSDLLFVEAILRHKNWSLEDWDKIYQDIPNRLKAQRVSDRKIFVTTDAERRLVEPAGLQDKIDALVRKYEDGRSFVRPSGTEDVVRVYAEAKTQQQADALADEVSGLLV